MKQVVFETVQKHRRNKCFETIQKHKLNKWFVKAFKTSMTQVVWVKSKGMYPLSQIKVHLEPNAYLLDSQSSLLLGGTFLLWQSVRYNLKISS